MKKKDKNKQRTKTENEDFYFDDCPVCLAMKQAETLGRNPTLQELEEAFAKANGKPTQTPSA